MSPGEPKLDLSTKNENVKKREFGEHSFLKSTEKELFLIKVHALSRVKRVHFNFWIHPRYAKMAEKNLEKNNFFPKKFIKSTKSWNIPRLFFSFLVSISTITLVPMTFLSRDLFWTSWKNTYIEMGTDFFFRDTKSTHAEVTRTSLTADL